MIKIHKITGEMRGKMEIIIIISRKGKKIEEIIRIKIVTKGIKRKKNKKKMMKGIVNVKKNKLIIEIMKETTKIEETILKITTKTNKEIQTLRVIIKETGQVITKEDNNRIDLNKDMLNLLRLSTLKKKLQESSSSSTVRVKLEKQEKILKKIMMYSKKTHR